MIGRNRAAICLFAALVSPLLPASEALAAMPSMFQKERLNTQLLSEFIYGDEVEQRLMPVYLLGEVAKPGLYHVPVNTDLTTLLAISGGPSTESELNELVIKNELSKKSEKINFSDLESSGELHAPKLKSNDVVFVPRKAQAISNNTLTIITVVATVLTAALTGVVLSKSFK